MYQFRLSKSNIGSKTESGKDWRAAVALSLALLGIASASILIAIAAKEIEPNAITSNRLLIAAFAFSCWNLLGVKDRSTSTKQPIYTARAIALLLVAGISFATSLALWAWSLTQTSIANSTLLNNMMPIFTTIGGWLLFRQRFSPRFLLGMAVAIGGAIAIAIEDVRVAESNLTGDGAALVAAMFSAVSILTLERLRVNFDTSIIMQWTSLAGGCFILPLVFFTEERLLPISLTGWTAVIGLGLISQAVGQGLLTYSLAKFSSGFVAVSMLSIPVIAAVLAMLIFLERLSLYNWLAFAVVLFGIYLSVSAKNVESELVTEE